MTPKELHEKLEASQAGGYIIDIAAECLNNLPLILRALYALSGLEVKGAREVIEHELFEICGAPEYGVDTETTTDRLIAALRAAGFELVPVEPTEAMLKAAEANCKSWWTGGRATPIYGNEPGYLWSAMISAAKEQT